MDLFIKIYFLAMAINLVFAYLDITDSLEQGKDVTWETLAIMGISIFIPVVNVILCVVMIGYAIGMLYREKLIPFLSTSAIKAPKKAES